MSSFVTGDLQNNVEKLRRTLRSIHYAGIFDVPGIISGEPETYLPLLDYVTMGFSRNIAKFIVQKGHDFYTRTDIKFIKGVFKFIREEFHYNPCLQPSQFLSKGFAERKIILVCKLVQHLKKKHNEIVKKQREKKRKVKTFKPFSRVEVIQEGSKPLKVRPTISVQKHKSPVHEEARKRGFKRNNKNNNNNNPEYDEDPCTHDTDPTYIDLPDLPKAERPGQVEEEQEEAKLDRPFHMKEELMNAMNLMKRDILSALKYQLDELRNEVKVRMTMMEGRVKFLEKALKEKRVEDSEDRTSRIINNNKTNNNFTESRISNGFSTTADSTMIRKDFTMRLPTGSTKDLSVNDTINEPVGTTRDFIERYRRKNEETLGIISDSSVN